MPSHHYLDKSICNREFSLLMHHKQVSLRHQSKYTVRTHSTSSKDEKPNRKSLVTKQHTTSSRQAPLYLRTENSISHHPHHVRTHHTSNSLLHHQPIPTIPKTGHHHHLVHRRMSIDQQATSPLYLETVNRRHQTHTHLQTQTHHHQIPTPLPHNPTNSQLNIKLSFHHQQCPHLHHPNQKPLNPSSPQSTPNPHTRAKNRRTSK
jgi:hypothetical protein